jgi:outer membrane protein assembly factor BamB
MANRTRVALALSASSVASWRWPLAALIAAGSIASARSSGDGVPGELEGRWRGQVTHGDDRAEFGFEFKRAVDGRLQALMWFPELNNYSSPLGWVVVKDGKLMLPEAGTELALADGTLSGILGSPELPFAIRRVDDLPGEPAIPDLPSGPEPAWTFSCGATPWASPKVSGDTLYIGDQGGAMHAVATADGKQRWKFEAGAPLFGDALANGDDLWFVSDDGVLFELDRASGAERRRIAIGGGDVKRELPKLDGGAWDTAAPCPVIEGDVLYLPSAYGVVHAIDVRSGEVLWKNRVGGKVRASVAVGGGRVFVGSLGNVVYALDAKSGDDLWSFDTGSKVTTPPVIAGELVVAGTRDRSTLFALDARDGKPAWESWWWLSWVESAPVLVDGVLYIGSSDSSRVRALDPASGRARWISQVFGWTWGTPLVVGDKVYCATAGAANYFIRHTAALCALDRASGKLVWRRPISAPPDAWLYGVAGSLAHANDKLFAALLDGRLIALPAK